MGRGGSPDQPIAILFGGEFLFGEFGVKFLFLFVDVFFVAVGVHERVCGPFFQAGVLFFESEVATMGAEENVAWQGPEDTPHALVVFGDLRVSGVVYELVARIHVGAAENDDVVGLGSFCDLHRPGGAAFGVARGEVRDEHGATEAHFISIVKHAVDLGGLVQTGARVPVLKVGFAAGFDDGYVCIHDHVLRAGLFFDGGAGSVMVPMCVADEKNFCVLELESELLNACLDQGHIGFQIAVDQNVALRCGDQIIRQSFAADVVEVTSDAKWREWFGPVGIGLGKRAARRRQNKDAYTRDDREECPHERSISEVLGAMRDGHGGPIWPYCALVALWWLDAKRTLGGMRFL